MKEVIIFVIGLGVGSFFNVAGLYKAQKSNSIAEEGLREAQKPYLSVKNRRLGEDNRYILADLADGFLKTEVQFELSNVGESTIKDIRHPSLYFNSSETFVDSGIVNQFQCKTNPDGEVDLLPGESLAFALSSKIPVVDVRGAEDFLSLLKNSVKSLPVNMEFNYKNAASPPVCMKNFFSLDIFFDKVVINYDKTEQTEECD